MSYTAWFLAISFSETGSSACQRNSIVTAQSLITDFVVIADYNEIINHPTEKCHVYLKSVPRGISRARLEVSMVDYLIEDIE